MPVREPVSVVGLIVVVQLVSTDEVLVGATVVVLYTGIEVTGVVVSVLVLVIVEFKPVGTTGVEYEGAVGVADVVL